MIEPAIEDVLIGRTPAMQALRSLILRVAPTTLPVLIEGPTGSGKELVARALHLASGRRGKLVALNVGAVGESLFEDALFGHVKGAFTGASTALPGYLTEADHGTCFLDEIGSLPAVLQAKLLRALDYHTFRPVGARTDTSSDFRLVAATNESIAVLVKRGRFREDLAFRLSGMVLEVPPLQARLGDVPLLVEHFARHAVARFGTCATLSRGAIAVLEERSWPGNVRELKHTVERLLVLAAGPTLEAAEVRELLAPPRTSAPYLLGGNRDARAELQGLLVAVDWDTCRAADILAVDRTTVYRRMSRLGIEAPRTMRASSEVGGR